MDKKIKYKVGTVLLSGMLVKGMFAMQPNVILTTGEALEKEIPLCAFDQDGNSVEISELVLKMMADQTVYLDKGYLYSKMSGKQIHPITGEEMEPVQDEGDLVPGGPAEGGEGTGTEGTEGSGEGDGTEGTEGSGEGTGSDGTIEGGDGTGSGGTAEGGEGTGSDGTGGEGIGSDGTGGEGTGSGGTGEGTGSDGTGGEGTGSGGTGEGEGTGGTGEGEGSGGTGEGDGSGGTAEGGDGTGTDGTGEGDGTGSSDSKEEGDGTGSSGSKEEGDGTGSSGSKEEGDGTGSSGSKEDGDEKDGSDGTEDGEGTDTPGSKEDGEGTDPSDGAEDGDEQDSSDGKEDGDKTGSSGHTGKGDGTASGRPKDKKGTDDSDSTRYLLFEEGEEEESTATHSGMNEDEAAAMEEDRPYKSNTELIANQRIVEPPKIVKDFRFWTVARKYAFAKENICIRESIPENLPVTFPVQEYIQDINLKKLDSEVQRLQSAEGVREAGTIEKDGLLYILKQEDNGWLYVESGSVRGFVNAAEVYSGKEADGMLKKYQEKAKKDAKKKKTDYTGIEGTAPVAEELIPAEENEAFTYLRATVNRTVINKEYAVADDGPVAVREEQDGNSRTIGIIPEDGLCYILADKEKEWIYVESGDVRGFVKKSSVRYGNDVKEEVLSQGEEQYATADEKVAPEENAACYYTLTSVKSGIPNGEIRNSIIEFASQFVGNPYVWGGTSLTNGADCSGFVQSIYRMYGYHLPRVADAQSQYGTQIPVECAEPGDLIFYAEDGYVYHVVMYAGDGKTIEAKSADAGIVWSEVDTSAAVWATRILEDTQYGIESDISEVNAAENMYGECLGTYKLTYYCACEICCDVETGITATGAPVVEGRTIAVDPSVIPYGTQVIINGHVFTAEDCGGAIKGNRIDIYVNDHAAALALGVGYSDVYLVK